MGTPPAGMNAFRSLTVMPQSASSLVIDADAGVPSSTRATFAGGAAAAAAPAPAPAGNWVSGLRARLTPACTGEGCDAVPPIAPSAGCEEDCLMTRCGGSISSGPLSSLLSRVSLSGSRKSSSSNDCNH